jgi:hypothetical protein
MSRILIVVFVYVFSICVEIYAGHSVEILPHYIYITVFLVYNVLHKVVQIWPGQTVTCLHTNRPGHIWTTLYFGVRAQTFRRGTLFLFLGYKRGGSVFHQNVVTIYMLLDLRTT